MQGEGKDALMLFDLADATPRDRGGGWACSELSGGAAVSHREDDGVDMGSMANVVVRPGGALFMVWGA